MKIETKISKAIRGEKKFPSKHSTVFTYWRQLNKKMPFVGSSEIIDFEVFDHKEK